MKITIQNIKKNLAQAGVTSPDHNTLQKVKKAIVAMTAIAALTSTNIAKAQEINWGKVFDTLGSAISGGFGAVAVNKNDSDLEKFGKGAGGVLLYEGAKFIVVNAVKNANQTRQKEIRVIRTHNTYPPYTMDKRYRQNPNSIEPTFTQNRSKGQCHKEYHKRIENGVVVEEVVTENCSVDERIDGRDFDKITNGSSSSYSSHIPSTHVIYEPDF